MPTPLIKKVAKATNKPESEIEKKWDRAVKITKERGMSKSDNKFYAYVMAVFKRMTGYKSIAELYGSII